MIRAGIRLPTAAELTRQRRERATQPADEVRPREGDDRAADDRDASRPVPGDDD